MKTCRTMRARIERSFAGATTIEHDLELEAHVADCSACRALYEQQANLSDALSLLPHPPVERLDVEASLRRINAELDAEPVARRRPFVWYVAAAAVILLGIYLVRSGAARSRLDPSRGSR